MSGNKGFEILEQDSLIYHVVSNFWFVLLVFAALLLVFHLVLVFWIKLGKVGWKWIDYVWLAVATIGLLSSVSEARRLVAANLLGQQNALTNLSYSILRRDIQFGPGAAICRQFVKSEYSPTNVDQIQNEYNLSCEYFKSLLPLIATETPEKFKPFEIPPNLNMPPVTDPILLSVFNQTERSIQDYNQAQKKLEELAYAAQDRSDLEVTFAMVAPLLLAFALALRITKVTGELCLERASSRGVVKNADISST